VTSSRGTIILKLKYFFSFFDFALNQLFIHLSLRLLCDHSSRLGQKGVQEIENHPFFNGIDWDHIREGKGPFVPELDSELDTKYFEEYHELEEEPEPSKKLGLSSLLNRYSLLP
tara:strand:+ start:711 stop:1052 length:342 start_codon:yes stop_codon:yes gene_type:complete